MPDRVSVGVVGVGHLGALHAEKYAARDDVELVAVYDRDVDRAATVAARLGCRVAPSLSDVLASCRAISVAVPVVAHETVGLTAIAAGCHVLMEKPLAASLAAGERLVAASSDAGVLLQVGVGRGESWVETRRLTIPFQGLDLQVNLANTYTLDDVLPADDGRLALISAVYKVGVSGSKDLGDTQGVFEGEGEVVTPDCFPGNGMLRRERCPFPGRQDA